MSMNSLSIPPTNTHTPQGFEAYVTRDMLREKQEGNKERDMIEVLPTDTKESLKRKRNGCVCEYFGCLRTYGLEWHHDYVTWSVGGEGKPVKRKEGIYRNISNFRPTNNPYLIKAYEDELMLCTLLCKLHHIHTHTHHRRKKLCRSQHSSTTTKETQPAEAA